MWLRASLLLAGFAMPAFGGDSADVLTAVQRQWLNNHPSLRIGVTVIPPQIIYDSKTQQLSGIAVDFIRDVETHLDYSFSLVHYETWDAMMEAADAGQIDIIFAAQKTPVRETKFVFTEPYLLMQNIIVTEAGRRDIRSMSDLDGKTVAVVEGASLQEDIGRLYPQIILSPVRDELSGLLGVSFGQEDAMVVEIARASYYIHDKKITNLRVVGDAKLPFSLGFACRKEMGDIRDILNAGLAEISPSLRAAKQEKWIHLPHGEISWRVLLGWLGIAAGVISAVFAWNLTLRLQIQKHRREQERRFAEKEQMQQELARFESQFRLTIDACPLGVHIHTLKPDGNLYFTGSNPAADKILCIDHRGLVGKLTIEAFPQLKESYIPDLYAEICQTGRLWSDDKLFYDDGRISGYFEIHAFQISPGRMAVMFSEISDRIKAQQALATSEAQLNSIFLASPVGLGRMVDRIFVHVNDRLCQMLGYSREELIGRNTRMVYASDEEYSRIGRQWYDTILISGREITQIPLRCKDGSLLEAIITASPLDMSDIAKGISFAVMDISDRVRAEKALAQSEYRFREMFGRMSSAVAVYEPVDDGQNFRIADFNPAAERAEKVSRDAIVGRLVTEVFPGVDQMGLLDIFRQVLHSGQPVQFPAIFYQDNRIGGWRENYVYRLPSGEIVALYEDVTERKRTENLLALNAERMQVLLKLNQMTGEPLQSITDFTLESAVRLTQSKIGYLAFVNEDETVLTMHSWSKAAMAECAITDKPIHYPVASAGLWAEALRQRQPVITNDYAAPNPAKKGYPQGHVPVRRHMNVPVIVGGKVVVVAGVGNKDDEYDQPDVQQLSLLMEGMWRLIERRRAAESREKLMKEIQAKNEELQSIVFISSHDLRSPLINIQGFSGELQKACRELTVLLGREPLKPDTQSQVRRLLDEDIPEALSFIGAGANKMDVLLKGLLNLSRIGSATIHSEPVDMDRLLASVVKTVTYQMRESNVCLDVEPLPACVGDAVLLNQVFTNLIDNAIKYRRSECETRITISGQRTDERVRYRVADNGIGISAEHTGKIFEIFHRLNPSGTIKGEGLGLTIVRRILDRLDGQISVESTPGQGSCFAVELPAVQQNTKTV